jgi:hypothetical protein
MMPRAKIKTAGDLRSFLADVMMDIRAGNMEAENATAISKIASQINQSLATEINAALQLEKMGKSAVAGAMLIGGDQGDATSGALPFDSSGLVWCEQCDARMSEEDVAACKSPHCVKVKNDAA